MGYLILVKNILLNKNNGIPLRPIWGELILNISIGAWCWE